MAVHGALVLLIIITSVCGSKLVEASLLNHACRIEYNDNGRDVVVDVGDDITLTCAADNDDGDEEEVFDVAWYVNQSEVRVSGGNDGGRFSLVRSRTFTSDTSCSVVRLAIQSVVTDDEGVYECRGIGRENAMIFVRVLRTSSVSTFSATFLTDGAGGGAAVTTGLKKPICYSNVSLDTVLAPSDTIAFTCMTNEYSFSTVSLDWSGFESIQMKDDINYSTTVIMDVQTALSSYPTCHLSCEENVKSCEDEDLSCSVPLVRATPLYMEVEIGGTVSFTCEVSLKNYTVEWFTSDHTLVRENQFNIQTRNDGRTSVFTISNVTQDQYGRLFCIPRQSSNTETAGIPLTVRFTTVAMVESEFLLSVTSAVITDPSISTESHIQRMNRKDFTIISLRLNSTSTTSGFLNLKLVIPLVFCSTAVIISVVVAIVWILWRKRHKRKSTVDHSAKDSAVEGVIYDSRIIPPGTIYETIT